LPSETRGIVSKSTTTPPTVSLNFKSLVIELAAVAEYVVYEPPLTDFSNVYSLDDGVDVDPFSVFSTEHVTFPLGT
jgi:hypothetical protein